MKNEDRNKIIDECINTVKSLIKETCDDHTPYCGACVSCGSLYNEDTLGDPEDVIEELEKLKKNDE